MVVLIGKNGKVLSTTEEFTRRRSCFTNVQAQLGVVTYTKDHVFIQDDTNNGYVYKMARIGEPELVSKDMFKPVYIPGKNPKKKMKNR